MKYNENKYYYDGYAAHTNGWPVDSSPLIAGTHSSLSWNHGWRDAENDSRKRSALNETDNANQQFESLATKQDEGWSGEGLPPVGCECEREAPRGWSRCRINYVSKEFIVYQMLETGNEYASTLSAIKFRPIRTEAERKREEAVAALKALKPQLVGNLAGILYDEIAAGKIPNIKLESPHE